MNVSFLSHLDVDGDNITDGKEIKGYKVKIITGWDKDDNPMSEMK